jgi:hypothetical protein
MAQAASKQVVEAPIATAWIDVATFSGMAMGMGMGGADMMSQTLGAATGGGRGGKAEFGYTMHGPGGRWMDVTLYTSRNTKLAEALQKVPAGTGLAPTLKLQAPEKPKPAPKSDDEPAEWNYEQPKGKLVMYWGCSKTVRPGQPKVVDLSTATHRDMAKFFESRRATKRGAHAAAGRPVWPSRQDSRALGERASIAGEHAFVAAGVPESFKFTVPAAQDIMAPMTVGQTDTGRSLVLEWQAVPHARAYFIGSMGPLPDGKEGIVIWTSSELPDSGFGLFDYQTNAAVDAWLEDKVLLPPSTTRCAMPKEATGEGGMLRAIAYGTELNLAYPPRPTDPKIAWKPEWSAKIRVKSMSTSILGMEGMGDMPAMDEKPPHTGEPPPDSEAGTQKRKRFNPFDAAKQSRP